MSNSGKSVVITAKWSTTQPSLTGGPLSDGYSFAQIHFHWGSSSEGSQHTVDGAQLPLEMHALFFKNSYENLEEALKHVDGTIVLVYFYQINYSDSEKLQKVFGNVFGPFEAKSSILMEPFLLTDLLLPFEGDYYAYWGMIGSNQVQWFITREVQHLSFKQLTFFQKLLFDDQQRRITRNFKTVQLQQSSHKLFHINPTYKTTNSTLSPIMQALEEQKQRKQLAQEASIYFIFDK